MISIRRASFGDWCEISELRKLRIFLREAMHLNGARGRTACSTLRHGLRNGRFRKGQNSAFWIFNISIDKASIAIGAARAYAGIPLEGDAGVHPNRPNEVDRIAEELQAA